MSPFRACTISDPVLDSSEGIFRARTQSLLAKRGNRELEQTFLSFFSLSPDPRSLIGEITTVESSKSSESAGQILVCEFPSARTRRNGK